MQLKGANLTTISLLDRHFNIEVLWLYCNYI
jgi:hypothetical protein